VAGYIRVGRIDVNGVTQNGSLNVSEGSIVHNSHTANSKYFGACFTIGDFSQAKCIMYNWVKSTVFSDQGQIDISSPEQQ
jgi:hypothetical protein